jgi:hypothetical protein
MPQKYDAEWFDLIDNKVFFLSFQSEKYRVATHRLRHTAGYRKHCYWRANRTRMYYADKDAVAMNGCGSVVAVYRSKYRSNGGFPWYDANRCYSYYSNKAHGNGEPCKDSMYHKCRMWKYIWNRP